MEIPNKRERQKFATNHSSNVDFNDLMKLYNKYKVETYSSLAIDTNLASEST